MSEPTHLDDMQKEPAQQGKDSPTRVILIILLVLWLITFAALLGVSWKAYFSEKETSQTLAQQIAFACKNGTFGPGISDEDVKAMCENAEAVTQDEGEVQDGEIQESENQDPEIQDPEIQDPENQDPENQNQENQQDENQQDEVQDSEDQESENQDPENQDPEIQDDENQDPEVQDEEIQNPEIDDPDPNDQIQSGTCTFTGLGTITLTFQTTSGPVTVTCTGNPAGGNR